MKLLNFAGACLLLSIPLSARASPDRHEPAKPFTTDGCTLFYNGNYRNCCVEHDFAYWRGGGVRDRLRADDGLATCVWHKGSIDRLFAPIMWAGVRIGGVGFLPTPFRWGYGQKYPRTE